MQGITTANSIACERHQSKDAVVPRRNSPAGHRPTGVDLHIGQSRRVPRSRGQKLTRRHRENDVRSSKDGGHATPRMFYLARLDTGEAVVETLSKRCGRIAVKRGALIGEIGTDKEFAKAIISRSCANLRARIAGNSQEPQSALRRAGKDFTETEWVFTIER